jgi:transposase
MTKLKQDIIKLYGEGNSYGKIQNILGCSKGTIAYHVGKGQKEKYLENGRSRNAKIRLELQSHKEKHGCFDCKEKFPHYMLDFDHKPEFEKSDSVWRVAKNKGMTAAWQEVEKCDVVCVSCHRIRTWTRNPW